MCNNCGNIPCHCQGSNQGIYGTNMWNVNNQNANLPNNCGHQQTCGDCIDIIKGLCVLYTDGTLSSIGISTNTTLNDALKAVNTKLAIMDAKFAKSLLNMNDINTRLNIIAGGTPRAPYTLL